MAVLKVRCPECDASIRQAIDDIDEPTDIELTCPRCSNEFIATAEPEAKQVNKKGAAANKRKDDDEEETPRGKAQKVKGGEKESQRTKAKKRKDDDEEDEDNDAPIKKKKKKKKEQSGSNTPMILGVGVVLLLVVGGIVGAMIAFSGSKDKDKNVAKADSTSPTTPQMNGGPTPGGPGMPTPGGPGRQPGQGTGAGLTPPTTPGTTPNGGSGSITPPGPMTNPMPGVPSRPPTPGPMTPGTGPMTTPGTGPGVPITGPTPNPSTGVPPKNKPDDIPSGALPPLPPPPKLRIHAPESSGGGTMQASIDKPRPTPPLSPEEDPFIRAKSFRAEGALPPLPKLPPANQRPVLALDSGGHSAFIRNVFITPAGDRVITIGTDKAVRFWDIKTGNVLNTIRLPAGPGDEGALLAAAISSKGLLAVSGTPIKGAKQGTVPIYIINTDTGALKNTLSTSNANNPQVAQDEVRSLSFSSDGNRLVSGSYSGVVQVFDVSKGASVARHEFPSTLRKVRFSPAPGSKVVAVLASDGTGKIADLGNLSKIANLDLRGMKPISLAWSNDSRFVAVGGLEGEIKVFNSPAGTLARTLPAHKHKDYPISVNQLEFLAGDGELLYGGMGGWAGVVSMGDGKVKTEFKEHSNTIFAVAVSTDGKSAVTTGGNQNETYVWSTATGKIIARLSGPGKGLWGIGWSQDGKSIAWGTKNMAEDVDGNCPLEEIFRLDDLGPGGPAFQGKFQQQLSKDENYIAKRASLVLESGEKIPSILLGIGKEKADIFSLPHNEPIFSCCVLPGRGKVAIGGAHNLYLLDPQTKELKTLIGTTGHTLSIAPSPDGKYFVTGSSDQTIRIWQPELDEPLLSIFVVDRDWIAWTPQGFYACSPHGERLLAWQVNNTAYKVPQVYPASRFRPSLYQPAIIKYLIPAGTLQYAMAMAQKFDKALVQTTSVADIVPPEVNLDAGLAEDLVIDQDTFTIKASAKGVGKQPITAMRLMVDGRPFKGANGIKKFDAPGETGDASWDVTLTPGPHTVAVIAETPVSKGMTRIAAITRKGVAPKPNLYVLAMGVSAYPGDMKLRFAASDAMLIAKAFQSNCKGVFANIEVRVLTDQDATKKGMEAGLDWLGSKMTEKDVGIVSFSGHGTRDENDKFFLVPVDINPRDVTRSCFAGDEFKKRLDKIPGRLVAILDACHSGDVAEHVQPPARSDSLVQDLSSEDSGVVVMCAALGREYAMESLITKAGYFTLGLVEGLEGHADVDEDGVININELDMYAFARVKQLSHGMQNSTTSLPTGIRPFPLATVQKAK
jgi:WD40 repeat protein